MHHFCKNENWIDSIKKWKLICCFNWRLKKVSFVDARLYNGEAVKKNDEYESAII